MLLYTNSDSGGYYEHIDKLPRIYPSFRGIRKKQRQRAKTETLQRRSDAGSKPFGRIVRSGTGETAGGFVTANLGGFAGSSGRSVKIWVKFALPDGNLPVKEENIESFHAHAYRMAVQCYQPILPFPITLREPSMTQSCRMTLDAYPRSTGKPFLSALSSPSVCPAKKLSGNAN